MIEHSCCNAGSNTRPRSFRNIFYFGRWLAPGAGLLLIPKCPLCIVAYVAMFSGIGLSVSVASGLRVALIGICVSILIYLATRSLLALRRSN